MHILANLVGPDILIVIAVIALLFGSTQVPKLARSLGSAKSEFERGISETPSTNTETRPAPGEPTGQAPTQ